jgi:hypothetical protein
MTIKLGDFVAHLKREGRYGQVANTNDPPTNDILTSINKRLVPIWARHEWEWGREPLSFNIVAGVRQYDVASASGNAIGRIQDLIPFDSSGTFLNGKPLKQRTTRKFFELHGADWGAQAQYDIGDYAGPKEYYQVGVDATNKRSIVLWPTPSAASKMGGYAKGLLASYTLADLVANNPILYFPNDLVLDALFSGCMIDIAMLQGMTVENAFSLEGAWKNKIRDLVSDAAGDSKDNTPITTALPATVGRLRSRRSRR